MSLAARVGAGHDVVEEIALGVMILRVLDHRAEAVIMEFLEQAGQRRALHFLLVERLHGGKPRRGARTGTGLAHAAVGTSLHFRGKEGLERSRDLVGSFPRREMAGIGHPHHGQIVDELVQPVELQRQQRLVLHAPDHERRHAHLGERAQQPVGKRHRHPRRRDDRPSPPDTS